MESEKSGFVNEESEIWRKMQVKIFWVSVTFRVRRSVMLPAQKISLFLPAKKEISMSCAIEL